MTIQECYKLLGGNYDEILDRLSNEKMIQRFVLLFLEDESFASLERAMASGNGNDAFSAAHTLKGVCANLAFTDLFHSSNTLTEELRNPPHQITEDAKDMFELVKRDYKKTVDAIQAFRG